MSRRQAFLDKSVGESRGVVLLDGRPERLIVERGDDLACQRLGARSIARVRTLDRGLNIAFLAMAEGPDATTPAARLVEGQAVQVEIAAEARADKGAVATVLGPGEGDPRLTESAPSLESRLLAWTGAPPIVDSRAREAADLAESLVLEIEHPLPGGGRLTIEATRALVAVDVDLSGRKGGDARRLARQANLEAINEAARLLRLKALGGLVVIDLVGKGHDGVAFAAAAKAAFAADDPGVSIGPISRFGLFELALPHRFAPLGEVLRQSPLTSALRLLRALEGAAMADPGGRLAARCSPAVAAIAQARLAALTDRFGARLSVVAEPARPDAGYEVVSS